MDCKEINLGGGKTKNIYPDGTINWYLNKKRHRIDGPATENPHRCNGWFINNKLHRTDGPAVEYSNGDKAWFIDGERHREDGPAIKDADGDKEWYLNGEEYKEEVFNFIIKRRRKITIKYWLKWTDYVMNPNTKRGKRHANRLFDKLVSM